MMKGRNCMAQSKKRGFTVTELIVVIAIIAILASMLLGAVMRMRMVTKVRSTQTLLQTLVSAIETMKSDYGMTRAFGLEEDGTLMSEADMDLIDLGKELDPKSPLWNPPPNKDTEIRLNKRLKRYYEVHKSQIINNQFVDPFGNRIFYRAEQIDADVDSNGRMEHYVREYLLSPGPNGSTPDTTGDQDDIIVEFAKRAYLGEDPP